MKNKKIIIGSRGSKLATIYAEKAKKQILKFNTDYTNQDIEIKKLRLVEIFIKMKDYLH